MSRALLPTELRRRDYYLTLPLILVSSLRESNSRPSPYHGDALPTELREHRQNSNAIGHDATMYRRSQPQGH